MTKKALSPFWVSFGVTTVAAILNIVFILTVLIHKSVFIIYTAAPKGGTSTNLFDTDYLAAVTSTLVAVSVIITFFVALFSRFKLPGLSQFVVLIQIIFAGIVISSIAGSVVYHYLENTAVAVIIAILITLASIVVGVRFANKTKLTKVKVKK